MPGILSPSFQDGNDDDEHSDHFLEDLAIPPPIFNMDSEDEWEQELSDDSLPLPILPPPAPLSLSPPEIPPLDLESSEVSHLLEHDKEDDQINDTEFIEFSPEFSKSEKETRAELAVPPESSDILDDIVLQLQLLTEPQQENEEEENKKDEEEEEEDGAGSPPPLPSCPPPALDDSDALLDDTEQTQELDRSEILLTNAAVTTPDIQEDILPASTLPISNQTVSDIVDEVKPVQLWEVEDVSNWLTSIGLGVYSDTFKENEIVGEHLAQLTREDIKDLGITKIGHLKTFRQKLDSVLQGIK